MRTTPLAVARDLSSRSLDAIAPAIPGFHPETHKRNVVVLLAYLLVILVLAGIISTVTL